MTAAAIRPPFRPRPTQNTTGSFVLAVVMHTLLFAALWIAALAVMALPYASALTVACNAVADWARARSKAATRRELHGLSDHTLRDIGLHRSQIDGLFR